MSEILLRAAIKAHISDNEDDAHWLGETPVEALIRKVIESKKINGVLLRKFVSNMHRAKE